MRSFVGIFFLFIKKDLLYTFYLYIKNSCLATLRALYIYIYIHTNTNLSPRKRYRRFCKIFRRRLVEIQFNENKSYIVLQYWFWEYSQVLSLLYIIGIFIHFCVPRQIRRGKYPYKVVYYDGIAMLDERKKWSQTNVENAKRMKILGPVSLF